MASSNSGGGAEPQSLSVRNFVAARVAEIASLTMQLKSGASGSQGRSKGFSFQHVSKHMRRRAVSHNPKRLPGRLRGSHLSQLAKSSGGIVKQPKRPSRKYRKRTDDKLLDFNRRQLGSPSWLESHVWHAKRFHMKPLWDKKLPISPTAKCFRSLFRAAQNRAVMQDISFLVCLEITGPEQVLMEGMNLLIPNGYEGAGANKAMSSVTQICNQELLCHVYSPSKSAYIGPVRCIWIPAEDNNTKLIIWAHPATKSCLIEELLLVFQLEEEVKPPMSSGSLPESLSKDEQKYSWKILLNKSWRSRSTTVELKDLEGCLNRVRLTGPKTLTILKDLLKIGRLVGDEDGIEAKESELLKDKQDAIWEGVGRIVGVPNNTVIPLNVVDPRLELPDKRSPPEVPVSREDTPRVEKQPFSNLPASLLKSPIWDDEVRKHLLRTKISDAKLAEIRGRNLIPGTEIDPSVEMNVVPVILIFRVGAHSKDTNSSFVGIDLIVPFGWLMPFWVALSYRCVRAYGLEFSDYLDFEDNPFLHDLAISTSFSPDASIYHSEKERNEKEVKEKYFSKPPAKRQNLVKLGCPFPFSLDWARLLKHSSAEDGQVEVKVIRRREDVTAISNYLNNAKSPEVFFKSTDLFPVQLTLLAGTIEERSGIFLPTQEDLEHFASGKSADYHILQDKFEDVNERERAEVNRQHQKKLAHLRKKRKVARRAASSKDFDLKSRLDGLDSVEECTKFNDKMNSLWVNENVEDVLSKQSREVLGLVTYAHYSFLRGKSGAVGYVSVGQLKKLVSLFDQSKIQKFVSKNGHRQLYVLVRNWTSSLHYHWAKITFP